MTFEEAQRQLDSLHARRLQGQITPEEFQQAVNQCRAQDASGQWWQPSPSGDGWLVWDGAAWQAGTPPGTAPISAPSASRGAPAPAAGKPAAPVAGLTRQGAIAAWERRSAGHFMTPQAFLELTRGVALAERPQAWWNLLSVMGGAISGYVWFVYGSLRGLPHLTLFGQGRESWLDFLPTIILAAVPFLAVIFRQILARQLTSAWTRLAQMSLQMRLILAALGLICLALFVTNNFLFQQREGLDVITPILMAGIPVMLVLFRSETDKLLLPIQHVRRQIPQAVLVGIGLATPFLVAFGLYYVVGFKMYPLLRANVLIGVLGSYALLRDPIAPPGHKGSTPQGPGLLLLEFLVVGILLYLVDPALADDFLRDPFNLNDGLRTNGIAPILSGVATTVVSILVNGVEVARVLIQATTPTAEGKEPEHTQFTVQVHTAGKDGAPSTTLDAENDVVFVYAHCEEAGKGRFPAGDSTIQFTQADAIGWVGLEDLGTQHGERCARVTKADTQPGGTPPDGCTITVSAGAGGTLISAPVHLKVSFDSLEIRWTTEPPKHRVGEEMVLPAKKDTEATLKVWAVKRDPQGGETVDWDVDFTHMQLSPPDGVPAAVFGIRDEPAQGSRQEDTVWVVRESLPCSALQKDPPVRCGIRVRVWAPQGKITRHGFSSITPSGALPKGEITIPVVLEDPPAKLELLQPEMPIPADKATHDAGIDVVMRLTAEYASGPEPLANAEVHWAIAEKGEKPPLGGRFDLQSGKTDDKGEIHCKYFPPELFYRPDGYYFEDLEVFRGAPAAPGGKPPKKIGGGRLTLMPGIKFKLAAEKLAKLKEGEFGLVFDQEREVEIPADEPAHTIEVTPRLTYPDPRSDQEENIPIAWCTLRFAFWNGSDYTPEQVKTPYQSDAKGTLKRAFPELAKLGIKDPGTYTLDPDEQAPLGTLNPMTQERIYGYERNVEKWCPIQLIDSGLARDLKTFRSDFAQLLAQQKADDYAKVYSAVMLLECAATHSHTYNELYANMMRVAIDQGKAILNALVSMAISYYNIGEKIFKGVGRIWASEKLSGVKGWVWERIKNRCGSGIIGISNKLIGWLPKLQEQIRTGSKTAPTALDRFFTQMEQEAERLAPLLNSEGGEFVQGLLLYFKLIFHFMAGLLLFGVKIVLNVVGTRAISRIGTMLFLRSGSENLQNIVGKKVEDKIGIWFGDFSDMVIGCVASANTGAPAGHGDLNRRFNGLISEMDQVLRQVLDKAAKANVPVDYQPRLDAMRQGLTALRDYGLESEKEIIQNDYFSEILDWLVWCVDWFLIAIAAFTSLGLGAGAVAEATRAIDIAWGLLQAALRSYYSFGTTVGLSSGIVAHYSLQTLDLVDSRPSATP